MSLRDHLQAIYDEHGKLTKQLVVDAARPKASPLHSQFEWDNKVAGEKYRLEQARELIRKIRISYREPTADEPEQSIRAWHAIRPEPEDETVYRPAGEIADDPTLTAIVQRDMEREWKALHRRYGHFREFVELVRTTLEEAA